MRKLKKQIGQRFLSLFLASILLISSMVLPVYAYDDQLFAGSEENVITSAEELPENIAADEVYVLGADIRLSAGQQIAELAGVLDGQGYTITLADKPLAGEVSGTIQNLGVLGSQVIQCEETFGSMAMVLTGVIQNCYSLVSLNAVGFIQAGGFAGIINGGIIQNSYMAGNVEGMFIGGLVGMDIAEEAPSLIKNACYVEGETADAYGEFAAENCEKADLEQLRAGEFLELLNTDIADTGFTWALPTDGSNDGFPVLVSGEPPVVDPPADKVNKEVLEEMLDAVEALNEEHYTEESWGVLQEVWESAIFVYIDDNATQEAVDEKIDELERAIDALEEVGESEEPEGDWMKPVAPPEDENKIIPITSQEDLENMDMADSEAYYVLENDITIDAYYWLYGEFQGVLDGKGHSVIFEKGAGWGIVENVGSEGVLQNIHFTGILNGHIPTGPAGRDLKGTVINCYSDVKGSDTTASGFATNLSSGSLINCYSVSEGANGVLVNQYNAGKLIHTYWQDDLDNPAEFPEEALTASGAKSKEYMQTKEFVQLLNTNRGEYGTAWGQNSNGYPYFGEDKDVEEPEVPETKYEVLYTPKGSTEAIIIEDGKLMISLDEVGASRVAGQFALKDVPKGSRIEWNVKDVKPEEAFLIALEKANLYVYKEGTALVTATEIKKDGSSEVVAAVNVEAKAEELQDIKLFINEEEVTNGTCSVEGSELTQVKVKGRYAGSDEYKDISTTRFTYKTSDESMIDSIETSSYFSFKKPGTADMIVTSVADKKISAKVTVTSKYVPLTGIKQSIPENIVIHGRDANSEQGKAYIVNRDGIGIEPENASTKTGHTIESSDPEVGQYVKGWVSAYVPYKAGTTTYTATLKEIDPNTKEERVVSDSKTVTYVYQNPLTEITMDTTSFEVEKGVEQELPMNLTGACSNEGYNLTEPGMKWTYEGDGVVKIVRKVEGYWKRETEDPDNNQYVQSDEYFITGLKEGTVTVTGTPMDNTNGVEPIQFTVTVKGDEISEPGIDQVVKQGSEYAVKYIREIYKNGFVYNDEWQVIALLRAGEKIDQEVLDEYYKDLVLTLRGWKLQGKKVKPTDIERAALALILMQKDITDIEGVNVAEMIYNHEDLQQGSNELAFALLVLDARDTEIPETAKWNRGSMIQELLKFQNPNSGGFGLIDNDSTSIDITGMSIQALAKYQGNAAVDAAIQKALEYLKEKMSDQCDFGSVESTSQVILALTEAGINPISSDFGNEFNNMIVRMMDYYCEADGGFKHNIGDKNSDPMAANQVLQALEAYRRYAAGEASYWEMTDFSQDMEEVENVAKMINELPAVEELTIEDAEKVEATRKAYNALLSGQKKNVTNYDVLLAAEVRIAELQQGKAAGTVTISIMDGLAEVQKVSAFSLKQQVEYKGTMLEPVEVPIYENDSMISVIERTCVTNGFDITFNRDKTYITSIDGLAEFDRGNGSGWMGTLNDMFVERGFANFTVKDGNFKDGDVITVEYTHNLGKDLQENAELKSFGNKVGTLMPEFDRANDQYELKLDADTKELILNPETYNRYSKVEIKANGVTYKKGEAITVTNGMEIVITSSKVIRGKETKTYTIQVKAEQKEPEKPEQPVVTLVDQEYGVMLEGSSLTEDMELVVTPLKKDDADVELMRKEIPSTQAIFKLYDIRLMKDGKEIELAEEAVLSIPVGEKYIRNEMTVLHCKDGKVEKRTGTASDKYIQVSVKSLGRFGVVVDPQDNSGSGDGGAAQNPGGAGAGGGAGTGAAKTGDDLPIAPFVMLAVAAIVGGTVLYRKIKRC